ncbi:MAG: ATP-binding protein [Nitrospirota bacterium]
MNLYFLPQLISGIIISLIGYFVFFKYKDTKKEEQLALFLACMSLSVWLFGYSGMYATKDESLGIIWARIGFIGVIFIPITFYHFTVAVLKIKSRIPVFALYLMALPFIALGLTDYIYKGMNNFFWGFYPKIGILYHSFIIFFCVLFIYSFILFLINFRKVKKHDLFKYNQAKYLMLAYLFANIGIVDFLPKYNIGIYPFGYIAAVCWISLLAYAIVKYRLMEITFALKKGTVYSAGLLLILAPAFLIILWAEKFFLGSVNLSLSIVLLSVVAVSAIAFYNLKLRTERALENTLFYKKYNPYKVLSNFTKEMVSVITLDELLNRTINTFVETLKIKKASIFLFDEEKKVYTMKASYSLDEEKNKIKIKQEDSLISHFITKEDVAIREEIERYPSTQQTQEIIKILKEMESEIAIPFLEKGQLTGFCNLGAKGDRSMYSNEDIELFLSLGRQACVAIQNAQLVERIKESKLVIRRIERLKTVGDLAAGFAHEIRNPLVPIKACLQLLPSRYGKDMDFTEKIPRYALQEVERIEKLLREIMDYSRPRTPVFQEEDINEVIENTVQFIEYQAKKKGIKIERGYDNSLPVIKVDREQIKQVLLNLIMNAMDAVNGIGKIEIATRKVRHMLSPCGKIGEGGYVQIEVRDNGTGIANEDLDRIFNPFYTTKHESSDGREGTGLGLSIVQEIVSEHCGFVDVRSEVGVGSSFYVNLPVETAEPKEKTGRRGEDAKIK